jgi:hypothetical protein
LYIQVKTTSLQGILKQRKYLQRYFNVCLQFCGISTTRRNFARHLNDGGIFLLTHHSFSSISWSDFTSGMKGFSVSGCVSNSLRKVTTPTESRLLWITVQHWRSSVFWFSVRIQSIWKEEEEERKLNQTCNYKDDIIKYSLVPDTQSHVYITLTINIYELCNHGIEYFSRRISLTCKARRWLAKFLAVVTATGNSNASRNKWRHCLNGFLISEKPDFSCWSQTCYTGLEPQGKYLNLCHRGWGSTDSRNKLAHILRATYTIAFIRRFPRHFYARGKIRQVVRHTYICRLHTGSHDKSGAFFQFSHVVSKIWISL